MHRYRPMIVKQMELEPRDKVSRYVQASASKNKIENMQHAKMTASAPREIHPCVYSKSTRAGGNRSVLDLAIVMGEPVVLGAIPYWCGVDGRRG